MKELPLYGKYSAGKVALVDDDAFEAVKQWRWWLSPQGYAVRGTEVQGVKKLVRLHRAVMNAQPGQIIDHINGHRLDCTRVNLRFCTRDQNRFNTARRKQGFKGVYWEAGANKSNEWSVKISCGGSMFHIGYFHDECEAAYIYDQLAFQLFGAFAKPNFDYTE